jgi:hypothetical protein
MNFVFIHQILLIIKSRKVRGGEHVARIADMRNTNKILVWTIEGEIKT